MRPFRERNPAALGAVALAGIATGIALALNLDSLPVIGGGTTYHAHFAEAAGLKEGEEVRVAGVKVGKVTGLDLEGDHVRVDFKVDKDLHVGDASELEIKIKTLLGAHYLALDPRGRAKQRPAKAIPISRTTVPYEVVPALSDLTRNVEEIDTDQLAKSFDTLSETFENSPEEIKASLRGLRRISETISSRDDELSELIDRAKDVTGVLNERQDDLVQLVKDGDKVLQAVKARRQTIHELLVNTYALAQQLNALIDENEDEIKPLLANLKKVTGILLDNRENLDRTIQLMAVYGRQFTDATGQGRWFDSYIQNLLPLPVSIGDPSTDKKTDKKTEKKGKSGKETKPESSDGPLPLLP
ncbi:MCE family protein [Actinocorallia sp. A-T 12471]|uniref:MCE family protein n=1 Tax=Actinocorallia sp. A-T 12471 TaxID=3089813 RepID=UPI0029D3B015|nr:MCE family protein [Actinocorallia sp. A-T 12471]MDX6738283.1 MCE family protein [Actinocorallia sp. A-T 12471]